MSSVLRRSRKDVVGRGGARALTLALALVLAGGAATSVRADGAQITVLVREQAPESGAAEAVVRSLGGRVTRQLPILHGFAARVPAHSLAELGRAPGIANAWRDGPIVMNDDGFDEDDVRDYDQLPPNTVWREAIRLPAVPGGLDGDDVRVAVLDTGVTRTADLEDAVVARVDVTPDRDGFDRFGHGTHMTGVIAGDGSASGGRWRGVAPGAEIVSVKVAGWDGASDVSAVLAGLQWVVTHKERHNIRVLNLSFGTDSYGSYLRDPLDFAVERVWRAGILVVVSAGNRGSGDGTISKPGDDPYVLTVGAADLRGTLDPADDLVAGFSSRGPTQDGLTKPDLVAPGVTIVASRAPNSTIDAFRPLARVEQAYFKGTGSSQAAAVVSGIAALMFEARPGLTPDVAKAALVGTANPGLAVQRGGGAGLVDAAAAVSAAARGTYANAPANQGLTPANGLGSLNESRGSLRVYADPNGDGAPDKVDNEFDALGNPWDPPNWSGTPWNLASWPGSPWFPLFGEAQRWGVLAGGRAWGGMSGEQETWGARYWEGSGWDARYWENKHWASSIWN